VRRFILKHKVLGNKQFMQRADTLELSAVIHKENDFYVALCPEFDIVSQGKNIEEALKNLKEALALYLANSERESPHPLGVG
jgi:predicted RNase H-like HicB family nuclease